jgi:S-adenosylmethionine:tRNA ribosyltransferase-isomerase
MNNEALRFADFDFEIDEQRFKLPDKKVEDVRLIVIDRQAGSIAHDMFTNLHLYLNDSDEIIMNDVGISRSRMKGHADGGLPIQVCFLLNDLNDQSRWEAVLIGETMPPGSGRFELAGGAIQGEILGEVAAFDGSYWLERNRYAGYRGVVAIDVTPEELQQLLEQHGEFMYPWYTDLDQLPQETLNPAFASRPGGALVSEPSRRMTPEILARCTGDGERLTMVSINLAFAWRSAERNDAMDEYRMNSELISVSTRAAERINRAIFERRRIITIGTGPTRVLESMDVPARASTRHTDIFISPGYEFKYCQGLLTNLHVPMSTHVVMASTFGGRELIIDAYEEASRMGYEFGIHGDAMLIIGDHEPSSYQEG